MDPARREVVASTDVPADLAQSQPRIHATENAVWLTAYNMVARIDPATNETVALIPIPYHGPASGYMVHSLAVDPGGAWVSGFRSGVVLRIDAATNSVIASLSVPDDLVGLVAAGGALWMADHAAGEAVRIDRATGGVVTRIPLGAKPTTSLWADSGSVWVEVARDESVPGLRSIVQIDAGSNEVVGTTLLEGTEGRWLGDGWASHGSLWGEVRGRMTNSGLGASTLLQMQPATGMVLRSINLPLQGVTALAKDASGVWMAGSAGGSQGGMAIRIDATTGREDTLIALPPLSNPSWWEEAAESSNAVAGPVTTFDCSTCGVTISRPVRLLSPSPPVPEVDIGERIDDWVPLGNHLLARGPSSGQQPVVKPVLNLADMVNVQAHVDRWRRTDGCCGTAGMHGPNLMCSNGHEIAIEANDCTTVNGVWLLPNAVRPVTAR